MVIGCCHAPAESPTGILIKPAQNKTSQSKLLLLLHHANCISLISQRAFSTNSFLHEKYWKYEKPKRQDQGSSQWKHLWWHSGADYWEPPSNWFHAAFTWTFSCPTGRERSIWREKIKHSMTAGNISCLNHPLHPWEKLWHFCFKGLPFQWL